MQNCHTPVAHQACESWHGALVQAGACPHQPQWVVCASGAPRALLQLLSTSSDPNTVSACLAALNNICILDECQERIYEDAKVVTAQVGIVGLLEHDVFSAACPSFAGHSHFHCRDMAHIASQDCVVDVVGVDPRALR
jgi:hypothetical protein